MYRIMEVFALCGDFVKVTCPTVIGSRPGEVTFLSWT